MTTEPGTRRSGKSLRRAGVVLAAVLAVSGAASSIGAAPVRAQPNVAGIPTAPGTAGLTPQLALAYTFAARDAHTAGVPLWITSGKRSRAEQQALWRDGIAQYGSPGAARRWVLPPDESTHVTGEAIDVAPRAGAAWLERNGNRWGLCRVYDNEWWHFELATVPGQTCPPRLPDASRRHR
ncbi:MAG: M15 family metallopeptidase [Gordonia sp. (in: high G+C Gram-positive bacteria)]